MIQNPKLIEKIDEMLRLADKNGLLTEVVVTAMEQTLIHGFNPFQEDMDQTIVNCIELSLQDEWGLY